MDPLNVLDFLRRYHGHEGIQTERILGYTCATCILIYIAYVLNGVPGNESSLILKFSFILPHPDYILG